MKKQDRICMFCENLEITHSAMGSEWTGKYGEDGFSCKAGVFSEFSEDGTPETILELRKLFSKAATCDSYLQPLDDGE